MIQSNELRVGNIVEAVADMGNYQLRVLPLHIEAIHNNNGCANPIPLTTEILLKSGFTKSYDEIFNLTFYDFGNVSICSLEGEFTLSGQKMPPMKYVHQMQNLVFILRGEEITIKL